MSTTITRGRWTLLGMLLLVRFAMHPGHRQWEDAKWPS
jgi:hypothetical protein